MKAYLQGHPSTSHRCPKGQTKNDGVGLLVGRAFNIEDTTMTMAKFKKRTDRAGHFLWILFVLLLGTSVKKHSFLFVNSFQMQHHGQPYPRYQTQRFADTAAIDMDTVILDSSNKNVHGPPHPLGPPEPLNSLRADDNDSYCSISRTDTFEKQQEYRVRRISDTPNMLHIQNYVSTLERYTILWTSRNHPRPPFFYVDDKSAGNDRTNSFINFMDPSSAKGVPGILEDSSRRLLFSKEMKSTRNGYCEPFQLVRYDRGGAFALHHDENHRVITIIYYLNGVAGTWFPLAGMNGPKGDAIPQTKEEALEYIDTNNLQPGEDGILVVGGRDALRYPDNSPSVVKVKPGDAVVFYSFDTTNFDEDGDSEATIDWRAIHAGLPASEDKVIATHWYNGGELVDKFTL